MNLEFGVLKAQNRNLVQLLYIKITTIKEHIIIR